MNYHLRPPEEAMGRFPFKMESAGETAVCSSRRHWGGCPCATRSSTSSRGYPAHCQQAVSGDTLVRHDAKQLAWGQAGVFHEQFEIVTRGKAFARLPRANGGGGNAQIPGDGLEGKLILPSPVAERDCKAGADVAMKLRRLAHGGILAKSCPEIKHLNGAYKLLRTWTWGGGRTPPHLELGLDDSAASRYPLADRITPRRL